MSTAMPGQSGQSDVDAWTLADLVTRLRRALRTSVRADYPWETLPMAQVEILQRLADEPGLRISDLAQRHRLAANTVSNLVQQMVGTGLLTRSADDRDRRAVTVHLTDAGRASLHSWLRANQQRLHAALASIDADDQRAIADALPALAHLVAELEAADAPPASS